MIKDGSVEAIFINQEYPSYPFCKKGMYLPMYYHHRSSKKKNPPFVVFDF
jgi:hypothetical protein